MDLEAIRYEGEDLISTEYRIFRSNKISILRNKSARGWFNVWNSLPRSSNREHILTFKITDMYSLVGNVLVVGCDARLITSPLTVQIHFKLIDDVKIFRHEVVFPITPVSTANESGVWPVSNTQYAIIYS